jgi:hypothetical protein
VFTVNSGPQPLPVGTPNDSGAPLDIRNPRNSPNHEYFNIAAFSSSAVGKEGDANRRLFHGPEMNNWDEALLKDTLLTESIRLQFRAESLNVFNRVQFQTPVETSTVPYLA